MTSEKDEAFCCREDSRKGYELREAGSYKTRRQKPSKEEKILGQIYTFSSEFQKFRFEDCFFDIACFDN
jgi:hypothetical protein